MAGLWYVIVPEAGTNLVPNPSAEATGNFAAHNSATVTRDTTVARFGVYSYKIVTGAINRGLSLTLTALTNAIHYASFYAYGNAAATLEISLDAGATWNAAAAMGGATGGWVRYGFSIPAAQANGSTAFLIRNTANETFYVDGALLQALTYLTTYIDGDAGPLYRWAGLRHGSTSTRDAQDRGGGRVRNLEDDFSVTVVDGSRRLGVPPIVHNLQGQALLPGASYQSYKILPREIELRMRVVGDAATAILAWANFHSLRRALIDLLKPDRVRGAQPVILGYTGADSGTAIYGAFRYAGGLEFGDFMGTDEIAPVRLLAVDPYWYEDNRETATLDFQDSVTSSAYANRRTNGQWLALGTGMQDEVTSIKIDRQRGRVYFGGNFTTANGVTVNGICYWNGTTFVAMDGGCNLAVKQIAIAANGDVWIGGTFTTVGTGAAATKGLARWNVSAGTWTAFNESTTAFTTINSIAISSTGVVYIAGDFTDWEGDAASDYIASTSDNGVNWDALGTSPFSATVYPITDDGMVFDNNGNLYVGSANTGTGTASLFRWNGSAWTTLGTTDSGSGYGVYGLYMAPDGLLYLGGGFAAIGGVTAANCALYNGSAFVALGSGVAGGKVFVVSGDNNGLIYLGGAFTSAGGYTLADRLAIWNGSTWVQWDVDLPGSPTVRAITFYGQDVFIGYSTTGTATAAGLTTITPTATAPVFPSFTFIGPSTADTNAVLQWLENQSTGHRLYFNLTVYAGETITITLTPGSRSVVSDWRGTIANQPLSNSDWAAWHLLGSPTSNTVSAFVTGTTTGVSLLCHWQPRHLSIDGPA